MTEAHNAELRDMMAAQKEELEEMRDEAAAARQVELDELKAAHRAELEQVREEARVQIAEAAAAAAATAEAAAAAAAAEGLAGLERTAAQLSESEAALNAKAAAANAELRAGREAPHLHAYTHLHAPSHDCIHMHNAFFSDATRGMSHVEGRNARAYNMYFKPSCHHPPRSAARAREAHANACKRRCLRNGALPIALEHRAATCTPTHATS